MSLCLFCHVDNSLRKTFDLGISPVNKLSTNHNKVIIVKIQSLCMKSLHIFMIIKIIRPKYNYHILNTLSYITLRWTIELTPTCKKIGVALKVASTGNSLRFWTCCGLTTFTLWQLQTWNNYWRNSNLVLQILIICYIVCKL